MIFNSLKVKVGHPNVAKEFIIMIIGKPENI